MWPGFASFVAGGLSSKDKLSYLSMIRQSNHLELQNANDRQLVSETIIQWMDSPVTRYEGLVLWHLTLETSQLYVNKWGGLLKASLELPASSSVRKMALKILSQMILIYGNTKDYRGAFEKYMVIIMPRLLIDLEDNEGFVLSCECLAMFMKCLPDALSTYLLAIEAFLVKHLDNDSVQVVEALADCFAILPKCLMHYLKPKSSYPEACADLYEKAINTLHSLMEDILTSYTGVIRPKTEAEKKPMFEIPCETQGLAYLCHKVRVFASLGRCLAKLMCSDTYRVRVYLDDTFLLLGRVISFPEEGMDASLINLTYPKLCQVAFMLMETVVLKFPITEFNGDILALALKAISNEQIALKKPISNGQIVSENEEAFHSEVRLSTYKFLNIWIKHSGCTVSSKIVSNTIVDQLLKDITISGPNEAHSVLKEQTCTEALKVLNGLIQSACSFFENQNFEVVISSILQVVGQVLTRLCPFKPFPLPYSNDNCRLELCNLLLTCCVSEHSLQKNCILRSVFSFNSALLKDSNIEVTSMCQKALNLLRYFINPKKPPPDYTVFVRAAVNEPPANEWAVGDPNYQQHLNVETATEDNLSNPPTHQADSEFQDAVVDNENNIEMQDKQNSPPTYAELRTSNHYSNSPRTRQSSQSDDHESEQWENRVLVNDTEHSLEEPRSRVSKKQKRSYIPRANRPNIQILEEAHSTEGEVEDSSSAEYSSDANVTEYRSTHLDHTSENEVAPIDTLEVVENGTVEESGGDEDEDGFDDEDDDDIEDDGVAASEERFSPDSDANSAKMQKLDNDACSEEECNKHSDECEDMGSNEGCTDEQEINPQVNGEEDVCESGMEQETPTIAEMVSSFVLAEAVES